MTNMSISKCHPLVTGSSGTGKTQSVFAAIGRCIAEEREALLTLTGFLASKYREAFQAEADSDGANALSHLNRL